MFIGASQREFDLVLVWSLDRFSREGMAATVAHRQRLASHETVAIAFVTGLIYVMAGSYQQVYQESFGFTYMSLDITDVVDVLRKLFSSVTISASCHYFCKLYFYVIY